MVFQIDKPGGGTRLLTALDRHDADEYRMAVSRVAGRIEASLAGSVVANRVSDARSLGLEAWPLARRRLRRGLQRGPTGRGHGLVVTDVRSCFESIGPRAVGERLLAIGCRSNEIRAVTRALESFAEHGVPGLPVGPDASAVLANAVLSVADSALAAEGLAHVRWVDDVVAFVPDAGAARRALARLAEALGHAGLELSPHKTRVLENPREARLALSRLALSSAYLR